jgi:hypothetical protein
LLLEVLLGQVLQVSLGEGDGGLDLDGITNLGDGNGGSEVSSLVVDLDLGLEVVLEVGEDNDVILNGETAVDGVLERGFLDSGFGTGFGGCLDNFYDDI